MKCLKNTTFPIKITFKKPNSKFQADWFLISGQMLGRSYIRASGRLQFLISQFLSGGGGGIL